MKIFYGKASAQGVNLLIQNLLIRKRIIFDLVLLGAIFYIPWWGVAILAFVGAFLWSLYYEIIIFGVLVDILYGTASVNLGGVTGALSAIVIFFGASFARKAVR